MVSVLFLEFSSEDNDNVEVNSNYADSMEEEDFKLTARTLVTMQVGHVLYL